MIKFNISSLFSLEHNGYLGEVSENGKRMPFLIRFSNRPSIDRAVVILHGHGSNDRYSRFVDEDWTVIIPLDIHGYKGKGSWWLGENGDLFTFRLLQSLIRILREKYLLPSIYFWGSSMGGYGAILHGTLMKSAAVFAHIPQIKLYGTAYTDGSNKNYYEHIFSKKTDSESYGNLCHIISNTTLKKSPVIFLSQNIKDSKLYLAEHTLPFIKACDFKGLAFSVAMPLYAGHTFKSTVAKTIESSFNENYKSIRHWRLKQEVL